jgi:hypothetical protein
MKKYILLICTSFYFNTFEAKVFSQTPKKDVAKIASISKQILTKANIAAYLENCHQFVVSKLPSDKKVNAEKILSYLKSKNATNAQIAAVATSLWMNGNNMEIALYIFGVACKNNSSDVQLLSNYAAVLTVCGANQLAIPILNKLNSEFSKNSTILNNLGQAWFALGDIDRADKYLDTCIRLFASHPQANETKSVILETKGKKTEAIEALKKSIKQSYTLEKEQKLQQLGYKISRKDVYWHLPKKDDGLGLGNFTIPQWPKNAVDCESYAPAWIDLKQSLKDEKEKLSSSLKQAKEAAKKENDAMLSNALQRKRFVIFPYQAKAALQYNAASFAEEYVRDRNILMEKSKAIPYKNGIFSIIEKIKEKYEDQYGEGKANPEKEECTVIKEAINKFIETCNTTMEPAWANYLTKRKVQLNEELNYALYSTTEIQFNQIKIETKLKWISELDDLCNFFYDGENFQNYGTGVTLFYNTCEMPEEYKAQSKILNWEDVNCQNNTSFNVPFIGKSYFNCRGSGFEFEPGIPFTELQMPFKVTYNGTDIYSGKSTVFISKGFSAGGEEFSKGPFSISSGAKSEISFFIEIGKMGISDAGFITKNSIEVTAGVKTNTVYDTDDNSVDANKLIKAGGYDKSIDIVNNTTKVSINAGFMSETTTILNRN